MKTKIASKNKFRHTAFWRLLKEQPGYNEAYKDIIKEGIVNQASGGKTESLSELYAKYPGEYSQMIYDMKNARSVETKCMSYDKMQDMARKRVLAAICGWLDKSGYSFANPRIKIGYAIGVACRSANCPYFNDIPESQLTAIYSLFCRKNEVDISGDPLIDFRNSLN